MDHTVYRDQPILVVDDAAAVRFAVTEYLGELGLDNIIEAPDGSRALELFRERKPHFVMLDVTLPGLDAESVIQTMLDHHPETVVIMITALSREDEHVVHCLAAGARAYLRKPVTKQTLRDALSPFLPFL